MTNNRVTSDEIFFGEGSEAGTVAQNPTAAATLQGNDQGTHNRMTNYEVSVRDAQNEYFVTRLLVTRLFVLQKMSASVLAPAAQHAPGTSGANTPSITTSSNSPRESPLATEALLNQTML